MQISQTILNEAVAAFDQIAATEPGARGRRASAVALVLAAIEANFAGSEAAYFLGRRAEAEIERLTDRAERLMLVRLLGECDPGGRTDLLVDYAARLEELRGLEEADAVLAVARSLEPTRPDLALRAARIARMRGADDRALALYRDARALDVGDGTLSRLADIGEALLASDARQALSRVIRRAVRAGDSESAAVGLEERARLRRGAGDRTGALRDLALATTRYSDPVDRGRTAFAMAEVCAAGGDPLAAREALLAAVAFGDRMQRDFGRARLYAISRDLGDQLGMRRWRSATPPRIIPLSPRPASLGRETVAPVLAQWRARLESGADRVRRIA